MKTLKRTLIILIVILLALISFGGIFVQKTKFVENILPEFKLGANLTGTRNADITVSKANNTVIYDKDGKVVEKEGEGTTKKDIPVNAEDVLTEENYKTSRKIIEERLNNFKQMQYTLTGISETKAADYYILKQDEKTGAIALELSENDSTNMVLQYAAIKGNFTIVDEEQNILMNNSHIEKAQVGYNSTDKGVTVYLTIKFNEEGTTKLQEISKKYVKTEDSEGKDTTKKITVKVDDTEMLSTYFAEEITNGMIQLSFGTASNDKSTLVTYAQEASNLAVLLNSGNLPITYTISGNKHIQSNIESNMFLIPTIVITSIIVIGILVLLFKYKLNGLFGAISFIGYIATLLVIIRLTNVIVTFEGIVGILVSIALDYTFTVYLLNSIKKNDEITYGQSLLKFLFIMIPMAIVTIVFCFTKWLPIYSFGMNMFWGITLIILYNFITIRTLVYKK